MLRVIRSLLLKIVDDIDAGNSNITEGEAEEGYNLKEGGSRGELSTKSLAKMSESLKRGYSEFPERREKIRNKALGRKMPKDTRCKISLNHSKSNLLKNQFGEY